MKALKHLFFTIVALAPLIYIATIWKTIPNTIPTHFNASMKPDEYGSKSSLWFICGMLAGGSLLVYFIIQNISRIDPRHAGKPMPRNYGIIAIVVLVFMALLNMFIISSSINPDTSSAKEKLFIPMLGLFFAVMGLLIRNVKPSYFVGVRVPWTLSSNYNWRKTHLLTSNLWLICGVLAAVLSLCLPLSCEPVILLTFVGVIVVVPIAYSFILFRKEQAHPEIAEQENNQ